MKTLNYDLSPQYDSRKSFYGKARVEETTKEKRLISYSTHVATIKKDGAVEIEGFYSNTTLRHIKEFLKQNGISAESKKELEKYAK